MARGADRGAEFHHGLVEVSGVLLPQHGFCEGPQVFACRRGVGGLADAKPPGEDPDDVPIDNGHGKIEGDAGDGSQGVGAYSGKFCKFLRGFRENAVMVRNDFFCRGVKESRASIITQALPHLEDFGLRCTGKGIDIGITAHPPVKIGEHGFHLSLLKHYFGDEDRVGVPGFPPGKFSPVGPVPFRQRL